MLEVNLKRDNCGIYHDWSKYMEWEEPSAVVKIGSFLNADSYMRFKFNASARNLYRKTIELYDSSVFEWWERNDYLRDIYEINTSKKNRQKKEMSKGYLEYPKPLTNQYECTEHYAEFIGCIDLETKKLVAYITAHFCGEMAAASQILGHAEHLKKGIMLNVWMRFVEECLSKNIKYIIYSRWKDGTDGLKHWKHSVGMGPEVVREKCN